MDKIVGRHKNLTVLGAVLLLQVVLLAMQVKRPSDAGVSLIRVWTVGAITPVQKALVHATDWVGDTWRNYFYTRALRYENERLLDENARLRMDQVRMIQDASQAQRLQALLRFKEQFVSETVAAQVIGTSGSETSRVLYIDKGANDGLRPDMAVVTPTGVVGKVMRVFPATAQVLEINDQSSGIGAILEKSRLQGILKGTPSGEAMLHYIMGDEKVEVGETVLTSGGDRIFPKGMPIGTVVSVNPGTEMFLNIRVKAAAQLDRVEEVLIITKVDEKQPDLLPENPQRAADILAARLPSVPVKAPEATPEGQAQGAQTAQGQAVPTTGPGQPATGSAGSAAVKPTAGSGTAGTIRPGATGVAKPAGTGTQSGAAKPGTAANTGQSGLEPSTTKTKPATAKPGTATAKPATEPNVFVNGHGVKHVSDIPNGAGAAQKRAEKPASAPPQ